MTSQFGSGSKNPPWAQQASDFMAASGIAAGQSNVTSSLMQQPTVAGNPTVYSYNSASLQQQQQYAVQQQRISLQNQSVASLPQPGMTIPTTFSPLTTQVGTVSYPAGGNHSTQLTSSGQKQRVFTGTVTKLHDNFGFVDEDVFFQTSCVKGMMPKLGDRVFVEASYNASLPFKWNATRVQVLNNTQVSGLGNTSVTINQQQQQLNVMHQAAKSISLGGIASGQGAAANLLGGVNPLQLAATVSAINNASNFMGSLARGPGLATQSNRGKGSLKGSVTMRTNFIESRFSEDRERGRDRRERDRERDKREIRRRSRSLSPNSHRSPKRKSARSVSRYVVQVPHFALNKKEASVITLKSKYNNLYIPSDFFTASYPYISNLPLDRPFVLGQQCRFHIMHKDVSPLTNVSAVLDPPDADHKFTAKVMLLSSPCLEELYSKSCCLAQNKTDDQESFQHPSRLLQFLVGTRGKNEPMAIGGPWSPSIDGVDPEENPHVLVKTAIRTTMALTGIDLSKCTQWYRFAEIRYLRAESRDKPVRVETVVLFLPDVWHCEPSRLDWISLQKAYVQKLQKMLGAGGEEAEQTQDSGEKKKEPTHYSLLDPKSLKLMDLRDELDSRSLSAKGLKSQLIARLTKALIMEEEMDTAAKAKAKEDEAKKLSVDDEKEKERKDAAVKKEEEEAEKKKRKEQQVLEKRYALPDVPSVVVHPHPTAKSGKFDCCVMSLSLLLDYRPEDNKEHSFEVSLFAELFSEMLMRDFGFTIYKTIVAAAPIVEEEKKKKETRDKEVKDKDSRERDSTGTKLEEPLTKKAKITVQKEVKTDKHDLDENEDGDGCSGKEDDVGEKDKKDGGKQERRKIVTVSPALLLSCVYFDQNHCGFLQEKDLEDIVYSLGLDLSRAQVRKLLQKVVSREHFLYRKWCDRLVPCEGESLSNCSHPKSVDDASLAEGNSQFLSSSPLSRTDFSPKEGPVEHTKETQFVMFRGSLVDLASLLDKLEGSDKSSAQLGSQLTDVSCQLESAQSCLRVQDEAVKSLKQEVVSMQSKLEVEVAQRGILEMQKMQMVAAVSEVKVSLMQASSILHTVMPEGKLQPDNMEVISEENLPATASSADQTTCQKEIA